MPFVTDNSTVSLARINALRTHFHSGATRPYAARRNALKALKHALQAHEEALLAAMHADMKKPRFEAYMADIGLVHSEINHAVRNLREWMRPERVHTPLSLWPASSSIHPQPLGVVLIIAPWNYPALLVLSPLVGAIAAGNCAVVKPSEETPHTAAVLEKIITAAFHSEHVQVVQGRGGAVIPPLMEAFRFDHLFFTGSAAVGRKLMAMAAPQLVPATLELGGKSPAIVDRSADIHLAAKRIAWSKFLNAGQTCIATDYALVHADVMESFLTAFTAHTERFFGKDPQRSPDFARMVTDKHFQRVQRYLSNGRVEFGGQLDETERYIAPTLLTEVPLDSPVMQEEIFGPVLPVIPWTAPEEALAVIARNPMPLACYTFSKRKETQRLFMMNVAFGAGCINHCMLHFGNPQLTFGGVGTSGMGRYHGKRSFELFSHHKGVVTAGALPEPGIQYPPYSTWKEKVLRWVMG
ncbi:MAG: aldehyde dehydrogenase family protein [Flavobacteriales bacterium]|nr:aldehyde dehydrogenase family protein [Flavobacteriales bacterium]MBP9079574.1 aldehyde dehydrogenase family protein [Flavobacteriales bacterium]